MTLRTSMATALVVVFSLACSGGSPDFSAYEYEVEMDPRWSELSLPMQGGEVLYSDDESLSAQFEGGSVSELSTGFKTAMEGSGWTTSSEDGDAVQMTLSFEKDGTTLNLAVVDDDESVTVVFREE